MEISENFGKHGDEYPLPDLIRVLASKSNSSIDVNLSFSVPAESLQVLNAHLAPEPQDELMALDNPVINSLLPVFWDNRREATRFFIAANNGSPSDISKCVNELKRKEMVCAQLCKRTLWTILHDAKIYPHSETNWNKNLNF